MDKGTATYPRAEEYATRQGAGMKLSSEEEGSPDSVTETYTRSDSEEEESEQEVSEGMYSDEVEKDDEHEEPEEKNWWDSPLDSD